jgi:hypothetical protein
MTERRWRRVFLRQRKRGSPWGFGAMRDDGRTTSRSSGGSTDAAVWTRNGVDPAMVGSAPRPSWRLQDVVGSERGVSKGEGAETQRSRREGRGDAAGARRGPGRSRRSWEVSESSTPKLWHDELVSDSDGSLMADTEYYKENRNSIRTRVSV